MPKDKQSDIKYDEYGVCSLSGIGKWSGLSGHLRDLFFYALSHRWHNGDVSSGQMLRRCYESYHNIPSSLERQAQMDSGIGLRVSLTRWKVDTALSFIRRVLADIQDMPITVKPTPIPELMRKDMQAIAVDILRDFQNGVQVENPTDYILDKKRAYSAKLTETAERKAENASRKIQDILAEGRFHTVLSDFLSHLLVYPYAVLAGPFEERQYDLKWKGGKAVEDTESKPVFKVIHPADYFCSSDTVSGGTGTFDIIRERVSLGFISSLVGLEHFDDTALQYLIENYEYYTRLPDDWCFSGMGEYDWSWNNGYIDNIQAMPGRNTVTILRYFGKMTGGQMKKIGVSQTGLRDTDIREVEAVICGNLTLFFRIRPNFRTLRRPIYTTSWRKLPNSLSGIGVAQIVYDSDVAFNACIRNTLRAMTWHSNPPFQYDPSRMQEYIASKNNKGEGIFLSPGEGFPVSRDWRGESSEAVKFFNFPNDSSTYQQVGQQFFNLAGQLSSVTDTVAGMGSGSGANRTYAGVLLLQANALTQIQDALRNVDNDVLEPIAKYLYNFLMLTSDDDDIKGDAKSISGGISELFNDSINEQRLLEAINSIAPMMTAMNNAPEPHLIELMAEAITKSLVNAGVDKNKVDEALAKDIAQMKAQREQQQQMQMQQMQQQQQKGQQ